MVGSGGGVFMGIRSRADKTIVGLNGGGVTLAWRTGGACLAALRWIFANSSFGSILCVGIVCSSYDLS
jgi:hypothetical protein